MSTNHDPTYDRNGGNFCRLQSYPCQSIVLPSLRVLIADSAGVLSSAERSCFGLTGWREVIGRRSLRELSTLCRARRNLASLREKQTCLYLFEILKTVEVSYQKQIGSAWCASRWSKRDVTNRKTGSDCQTKTNNAKESHD